MNYPSDRYEVADCSPTLGIHKEKPKKDFSNTSVLQVGNQCRARMGCSSNKNPFYASARA